MVSAFTSTRALETSVPVTGTVAWNASVPTANTAADTGGGSVAASVAASCLLQPVENASPAREVTTRRVRIMFYSHGVIPTAQRRFARDTE